MKTDIFTAITNEGGTTDSSESAYVVGADGALCEHEQAYVDLTSAALKGGSMPGALSKARSAALSAVGDDTVVANAIGVMSMFNGRQ